MSNNKYCLHCRAPAPYECACCGAAHYCSRECQVKDFHQIHRFARWHPQSTALGAGGAGESVETVSEPVPKAQVEDKRLSLELDELERGIARADAEYQRTAEAFEVARLAMRARGTATKTVQRMTKERRAEAIKLMQLQYPSYAETRVDEENRFLAQLVEIAEQMRDVPLWDGRPRRVTVDEAIRKRVALLFKERAVLHTKALILLASHTKEAAEDYAAHSKAVREMQERLVHRLCFAEECSYEEADEAREQVKEEATGRHIGTMMWREACIEAGTMMRELSGEAGPPRDTTDAKERENHRAALDFIRGGGHFTVETFQVFAHVIFDQYKDNLDAQRAAGKITARQHATTLSIQQGVIKRVERGLRVIEARIASESSQAAATVGTPLGVFLDDKDDDNDTTKKKKRSGGGSSREKKDEDLDDDEEFVSILDTFFPRQYRGENAWTQVLLSTIVVFLLLALGLSGVLLGIYGFGLARQIDAMRTDVDRLSDQSSQALTITQSVKAYFDEASRYLTEINPEGLVPSNTSEISLVSMNLTDPLTMDMSRERDRNLLTYCVKNMLQIFQGLVNESKPAFKEVVGIIEGRVEWILANTTDGNYTEALAAAEDLQDMVKRTLTGYGKTESLVVVPLDLYNQMISMLRDVIMTGKGFSSYIQSHLETESGRLAELDQRLMGVKASLGSQQSMSPMASAIGYATGCRHFVNPNLESKFYGLPALVADGLYRVMGFAEGLQAYAQTETRVYRLTEIYEGFTGGFAALCTWDGLGRLFQDPDNNLAATLQFMLGAFLFIRAAHNLKARFLPAYGKVTRYIAGKLAEIIAQPGVRGYAGQTGRDQKLKRLYDETLRPKFEKKNKQRIMEYIVRQDEAGGLKLPDEATPLTSQDIGRLLYMHYHEVTDTLQVQTGLAYLYSWIPGYVKYVEAGLIPAKMLLLVAATCLGLNEYKNMLVTFFATDNFLALLSQYALGGAALFTTYGLARLAVHVRDAHLYTRQRRASFVHGGWRFFSFFTAGIAHIIKNQHNLVLWSYLIANFIYFVPGLNALWEWPAMLSPLDLRNYNYTAALENYNFTHMQMATIDKLGVSLTGVLANLQALSPDALAFKHFTSSVSLMKAEINSHVGDTALLKNIEDNITLLNATAQHFYRVMNTTG